MIYIEFNTIIFEQEILRFTLNHIIVKIKVGTSNNKDRLKMRLNLECLALLFLTLLMKLLFYVITHFYDYLTSTSSD